ncbi:MAG TPA: ABC transporter substrate-binding protein, partial [Candidatus Limnocylindria bacterium]|nr:ABC transporter substrate-binding protein [Candidatus Limnocylindria bacterium]
GGRNRIILVHRNKIILAIAILAITFSSFNTHANPFLPKPGETPLTARVGTCSITGGFIHLYTALFNGLFDKYGIKMEHVTLRGGVVSLAALSTDEIQFVYCSADPMIPRIAAGIEAKLIGSPIVGLPWVLVGRREIKRPQDLKGKSIAVSRPGGLTDQLAKAVMKKFNLTNQDLKLVHIGGTGQLEPYNAMMQGLTQATLLTPPLDVRARRDGFHLIYNLNDLGIPSIYSSTFAGYKSLKDRPVLVQRFTAALAESIHFLERNPDRGKAALAKILSLNDQEVLQSAYDAYAKALVNRRLAVPANAVAQAVENAREDGTQIRRKPAEIFDNSFAEQLDKSGFLKELWGNQL